MENKINYSPLYNKKLNEIVDDLEAISIYNQKQNYYEYL